MGLEEVPEKGSKGRVPGRGWMGRGPREKAQGEGPGRGCVLKGQWIHVVCIEASHGRMLVWKGPKEGGLWEGFFGERL